MTTSDSPSENPASSAALLGTPPTVPAFSLRRVFWIGGLSLPLLLGTFWFSRNLSQPLALAEAPSTRPSVLQAANLRAALPAQAQEGQPISLALHLLNQGADPVALRLHYGDTSYAGQPRTVDQVLSWQGTLLQVPLIFESPGEKRVTLHNQQGQLLKSFQVRVTPFPASVFPKAWESHQQLNAHPQAFHLWVNLY